MPQLTLPRAAAVPCRNLQLALHRIYRQIHHLQLQPRRQPRWLLTRLRGRRRGSLRVPWHRAVTCRRRLRLLLLPQPQLLGQQQRRVEVVEALQGRQPAGRQLRPAGCSRRQEKGRQGPSPAAGEGDQGPIPAAATRHLLGPEAALPNTRGAQPRGSCRCAAPSHSRTKAARTGRQGLPPDWCTHRGGAVGSTEYRVSRPPSAPVASHRPSGEKAREKASRGAWKPPSRKASCRAQGESDRASLAGNASA